MYDPFLCIPQGNTSISQIDYKWPPEECGHPSCPPIFTGCPEAAGSAEGQGQDGGNGQGVPRVRERSDWISWS